MKTNKPKNKKNSDDNVIDFSEWKNKVRVSKLAVTPNYKDNLIQEYDNDIVHQQVFVIGDVPENGMDDIIKKISEAVASVRNSNTIPVPDDYNIYDELLNVMDHIEFMYTEYADSLPMGIFKVIFKLLLGSIYKLENKPHAIIDVIKQLEVEFENYTFDEIK
jgi:hypothetical protein